MDGNHTTTSSNTHSSSSSISSNSTTTTTYAHSAPTSRVSSYAALAALSLARPSAHVFPVVLNSHSRSTILTSSSRSSARWREAIGYHDSSLETASETEAGTTTSDSSTDGNDEDWSEGEESPVYTASIRTRRDEDATTPTALDERPQIYNSTSESNSSSCGSGGASQTPKPLSSNHASSYFAQDAAIALARAAEASSSATARRRVFRTRSRTAGSSPLLPATSLVPLTTSSSAASSSVTASGLASASSEAHSTIAPQARRARSRSWVSATGLAFTPTPRTASPSPTTLLLTPQPEPPVQLGERATQRCASTGTSSSSRRRRAGSASSSHSFGTLSISSLRSTTATAGEGGARGERRPRRGLDGAGSETEAEADALGLGLGAVGEAGATASTASTSSSRRSSGLYVDHSATIGGTAGGYFTLPYSEHAFSAAHEDHPPPQLMPNVQDLPPPYSPSRPASPPRFQATSPSLDAALLHDSADQAEQQLHGVRRRRRRARLDGVGEGGTGNRDRSTSCATLEGASVVSATSHATSLGSPPPRVHRALPPPLAQTFEAPTHSSSSSSTNEAGLLYLDMSASSAWVMRWLLHPLRLLAAVPGCIGTFWLLRHAMLCAFEQTGQPGMPSAAQYAVASLWSISTAYHALSFTTLLLRRWLAYYALPSSLIRLVALQAICWPLVRLTVLIVGVRSPLAAWVIIGTTTAFSDTVARWVTSNIADRPDEESEAEQLPSPSAAGERRETTRRTKAQSRKREHGAGRWFWRAIMGVAPQRARLATGFELPPSSALLTHSRTALRHPRTTALSVTSGPESEWESDLDAGLRSGVRSNSEVEFNLLRSDAELDVSSPEEFTRDAAEYLARDAYDESLVASRHPASPNAHTHSAPTRERRPWNARAAAHRKAARSIRDKHPARVFHWGVALRRNVLPIALLGYTSMWVLLIDAMRSAA